MIDRRGAPSAKLARSRNSDMQEPLKQQVYEANLEIVKHGLVLYTWGNVSGYDPDAGVVAIKPSGVEYAAMKPGDMVLVDLEGNVIEGALKPSSDTATHLELYRAFPELRGIVHTHSTYATVWAQAARDLPCYGTTHADYFHGPVPCTAQMTPSQIADAYEANTGKVIVECFEERRIGALECPAVLVAGHAPFAWGDSVQAAVHNAVVLEQCALMGLHTATLKPESNGISRALLDKHFLRKHGPGAYYGQN